MVGLQPERRAVLDQLASQITAVGAVRVGVDGVDGAGKTTFADALAAVLRAAGHEVVRVPIDGFHNPRDVRYRRGRSSPEGFWLDSYDYERFTTEVLEPFSPGGRRRFRRAIRDVATDQPVDTEPEVAPHGAILIVDGIFLLRDELVHSWDVSVFLRVGFDETFARMAARDGCPPHPAAPANRRYLEGQRLYIAECDPESRADMVIDNTDPARPQVVTAGTVDNPDSYPGPAGVS